MASLRTKLTTVAVLGVLGGSGWLLHSVFAAQAQGVLAQAPLNNQVQVPPAFIMALDDSGSMRFQTLFPSRDGGALWSGTSFFYTSGSTAGQLRTSDSDRQFVHVAPYPAPRQAAGTNDNAAIPPIDAFGFSRSHVYNKAYFDPGVTYAPWRNADGSQWADANPKAIRVNPNTATPTFDATVEQTSTSSAQASNHQFRVRNGMVMPIGLKYYDSNDARACGLTTARSNSSTPSGWRVLTQAVTVSNCDRNLYIAYFPATFYLPSDEPAPAGFIEGNRVLVQNACTYPAATGLNRCDMHRYEIRPANYSSTAAYNEAITNFANWFSFYGARNRSMVAAISNALVDVTNLRVGYFTINNRANVTMRDMAQPTQKQSFYDSIFPLGASGNTPNLQAVEYLGQQFRRTGNGAPIALACQKNAGMLFTDGFSNVAGPTVGNVDGTMGDPFRDTHSNTLADIATRFYRSSDEHTSALVPLRTGGGFPTGQVPVPAQCSTLPANSPERWRLDCQADLHMNFYGVTLGSRGVSFDPDTERDPLEEPYVPWPAFQSNQRSTIDDIWHATVNTRGDFINAKTPEDITSAIRSILQSVSAGASPSGTLALTGSRINSRSLVVQPSYEIRNEGTDWFSELVAYKLDVNPLTREVTETEIWEASEELAAQGFASRRARAWYGTGTGAAQLTGVTLDRLCDSAMPGMSRCTAQLITDELGITASQAVDYLMGDASLEVKNPGGSLRNRTSVLGDIINSAPVVSAPTDDYGYRSLGTIGGVNYGNLYRTYVDTTKASRPAMVYVGANDGMLHAFHGGINADGDVDATNGGRERFAYIPRAVLGHMGNLLFPYVAARGNDQRFDHRYFVDGPIVVSDAYYRGGWKTVLVGTAGAGGRSVFGLDVSDPGSFDSGDVLWEIDDQHGTAAVRNSIGHVLGRPVVVPVRTGSGAPQWKAIFGNGYNSVNGTAALFVVDIATGSVNVIRAVETGGPAGANGLGNIVVTDQKVSTTGLNGRDGFADTVYAADQKGAIWKFDLSSTATLTTPLFTTQTHNEGGDSYRQPIIGGISATAGVGNGVMLFFGTGSFSFVGDASDDSVQSIYAVNDRGQSTTMTAADLFEREIVTSGVDTRTISTGGVVGQNGWYLDLPARERAVGYPRVASGVLFVPTYAPNVADGCSTSGFNWLYGLNTRTGGPALEGVRFGSTTGPTEGTGVGAVALDTGGTAPVKEVGLTVLSRPAPPNPGAAAPPEDGCWMRISVAGMAESMFVPYPCGRQSWRQLQ